MGWTRAGLYAFLVRFTLQDLAELGLSVKQKKVQELAANAFGLPGIRGKSKHEHARLAAKKQVEKTPTQHHGQLSRPVHYSKPYSLIFRQRVVRGISRIWAVIPLL